MISLNSFYLSEQEAGASKDTCVDDDWDMIFSFLAQTEEGHGVYVAVVLVGSVRLICQDSLHCVVELVSVHVCSKSAQS